jgi:hypothetical protein
MIYAGGDSTVAIPDASPVRLGFSYVGDPSVTNKAKLVLTFRPEKSEPPPPGI